MQSTNRRDFVKGVVATGLVSSSRAFAKSQVRGANDDIRVAVIGTRSQGNHHIEMVREVPGVRLVAVCEVDEEILNKTVAKLAAENLKVEPYIDVRKLLENKDIDAVTIATPNHWHSLMTIWACQAGKDVYVEKPISHNLWEGRKAVEACRKYNRVVQAGTQSRSDEALHELRDYLKSGQIGKIVRARGFCYKRRASIGKVAGPQPIPVGMHYDLWTGPAPLEPLRRQQLHYDWHWVWATGNGDIGNQGIHEMDMARWMLGQNQFPARVMSLGGRFGYDDDGQTPNTQVALLDYEPAPLIFEVRGLPEKAGMENMDHYRSVRVGIVVECEDGYFAGGAGGGWIYDKNDKKVKQLASTGGDKHFENFFTAVRNHDQSQLKADILEGHISTGLCHLANISYELGTRFSIAEIKDKLKARADLTEAFDRMSQHLSANALDLTAIRPVLGAMLSVEPERERFVSEAEYDLGNWGNQLLASSYRVPFVVPQEV